MVLRDIKNDLHTCQVCKRLVKDEDVANLFFYSSFNARKDNIPYDEVEVCELCRNKIFNMIKEDKIK